ncbi:phage tail protein [uncultured Psychrobacter sp.]|uniref:host specificity protein J n=1 Tax=uncultured Psychrobacter sp. TaxID=259303 RepID=UPI0025943CD6|nr:phage tail protein [uncultured Psychrobacter sp.]
MSNIKWRNDGSGLGDADYLPDGVVMHDMVHRLPVKGAKKKPKQPRKPVIAKDSASSISFFKGLYGTSEGEIYGLVDGGKSIFLEGTPLLDDDGNPNFENVTWEERKGTLNQEYMKGFPDVSNEVGIGVELKGGTPWVRSITNTQLSALRLRFKWDRLAKTNPDNGDVTGYRIDYAIDLRTDGGAYQEVLSTKIEDKTSAGYERTHRIDLPKSKTGWSVRVRRITPNANSEYIADRMFVDALAEVIDVKLAYPYTAGIGLQYNAETFNGVAKVEFLKRGRIIKVPTNYNAETRTYTGIWDGTFKEAYSNNPAWVLYDLLTSKRYGLGHRLNASMIDKWGIYNHGRYCDEMVSDGQGGLEPRFTCNVYLQKQATAYEVLQHIAGIFSALSYWNGEKIFLDADVPRDPVFTFTNANVVGGGFNYSGTRDRDRHNIIRVAWDNPANGFKTEYEYVRDERSIAMNGIKPLDLAAFGCTSQSQAQRLGLRALKTEQLETQQVTFSAGLAAINCKVGDVIAISDASLAGKSNGGLISSVAGNVITIDRDAVINIGDTLTVNTAKGLSERRNVTAVSGRNITVAAAFDGAEREHVWSVESSDLKMQLFRVMSVTENDDATYSILGIQHEPQKFNAIDFGTDVKPTSISIVDDIAISPPESVVIKSRHRVEQGQTVATLIIEWSQVKEAVAYEVEWRKDDGSWVRVPRTGTNSVEIDGVYAGQYLARVRSVGAFDSVSNATTSTLTEVKGKVGKPPALASLRAVGKLFSMELSWSFAQGSKDADYVEIEQGSAPDTNVSLLGQFSYPTDRHEITGLQGGLTRSYRARLVDKLGFKSDWTAWATATVDDNPDKVLDLIEGQITESHLYKTLTDKIDKVSKIEPLELLVGDETKGLVKAIADERQARIAAIGTSALEGSKSLHERADALAGTVNGITEWQEEVDTDIEKSFAKMTYLASELDFGYADKTQYASKARGTAWTFAKTVARADYVNSELARGLTADLAGTKASFTEQITATTVNNLATVKKVENLSAQVVGGYEGDDLGKLSSGLLYQERTARASDYSALSEQISLLSAGVGEQFDPYQIWHFDKNSEGWTGGTYNGGYINARTDKLQSPSMSKTLDDGTIETLSTNAYHHIKMRLEVVGTPTWSGLVEWAGGSTTITEPKLDGGVANVSFDLKWSGSIDKFAITIAKTADNLNYYKVDWIAVGRPSPGASSAAVLDIKRAFSDYKLSSSETLTDLTSAIYGKDLTPLTASIREQLKTLATDSGTYADKLTVLDAWYKGEDASMAAITKQQYEALTSADSANARKVDELFAEMDFGYADRTKFANINRTMQRTFAMSIAVADWNQSQRIDTLQSEFKGNTAQIQNELLTLASKDLSIASEQTRLSTAIGKNSSDILDLSLAVTDPEKGLSAKVTQLQATAETAQRLAGTKGEIIYSVAEPPAKDRLPQNLWFKKEGENTTPHVWDVAQSKWVALTDKAAADAQAEAEAAKQAAGIAQDAAEAKGEVIFSSTAPEATKQLKQNLWIDTAGGANTPKRWDGSAWVEVTDKATKDAASAAGAAQGAAQAAQDAADEADRKAREALGELDDISDDDKLTPSEKKQLRIIVDDIKQVDTDIKARAAKYEVSTTEYDKAYKELVTDYINDLLADYNTTSNIVRTEFNRKFNEFFAKRAQLDTSIAIAAKSVADDAQTVANNKGEVIYSSTAPAADKRKTQNLWVDTTGGKNVFKRWNGSAWVAVTDQTAVDIANSKGEVITSDKIPDATKRLSQNLWIDTRQGKNTPRRWNGTAWEAVTDQAAIDAVNEVKLNLATYVEESGAYSTEFGNISGKITTMQSTVEGVTDSIEVVAAIGDAERLKYEISKERLNKNKAALQGKVADLDSLIAKYKAQRTDAQAKKAQATDAAVIASYDSQIALLNTSITDAETQRNEVASQVTQLEQEIAELASLKLTESEVKKQYFVKFDSGNRAAGFGIMENADATIDFAVLADKFYIAPPSGTGKGVRPFAVYTSPTTINGVVVPAGTYMDNAFIANGTLDAAKIKDATITSAKIGQAEIKTVNIAQAAIKSAQIDDLAVTSGKIANLAVDTLQIAGNAVTLPVASSNNNDVTLKYRTYQQVLSVSIPVSGSCSLVFTTYHRGQVNDTNNASLNVRAVFNGEIVASGTISNVTSSMGRFSFGQSAVFARMFDAKATGTLIIEAEGEDNGYIQNSYLMATILRR